MTARNADAGGTQRTSLDWILLLSEERGRQASSQNAARRQLTFLVLALGAGFGFMREPLAHIVATDPALVPIMALLFTALAHMAAMCMSMLHAPGPWLDRRELRGHTTWHQLGLATGTLLALSLLRISINAPWHTFVVISAFAFGLFMLPPLSFLIAIQVLTREGSFRFRRFIARLTRRQPRPFRAASGRVLEFGATIVRRTGQAAIVWIGLVGFAVAIAAAISALVVYIQFEGTPETMLQATYTLGTAITITGLAGIVLGQLEALRNHRVQYLDLLNRDVAWERMQPKRIETSFAAIMANQAYRPKRPKRRARRRT